MAGLHAGMSRLIQAAVIVPTIVFGLAVGCFLRDSHSVLDFPLDDGWIHRVYSRSIAQGHGFAYNVGQQEAGATSPLWCILTAPAHWAEPLGTNAVVCLVKLIGASLALATVLATAVLAKRVSGSTWAACIAASLFALEPRLLFSSLSGMENVLLVALWSWTCIALLDGRFSLSLVLFSLIPLVRPEAVVILPFSALAMVSLIRRGGLSVSTLTVCSIVTVPMLLWMAFCHHVTGHWLPNTYYCKASSFEIGPRQLDIAWRAVMQHGFASLWIFLPGLAAFVALFVAVPKADAEAPRKKHGKRTFGMEKSLYGNVPMIGIGGARGRFATAVYLLMLLAAPTIYLLGVVGTRAILLDGYYWTRWVEPACLMLTLAFCVGYGSVLAMIARRQRGTINGIESASRRVVVERIVGIAALLAIIACAPRFCTSFGDQRRHLSSDSRVIAIMNVEMGKWIKDHTAEDAVVAVNDAGAIRYFGQRYTVDLMGLNNAEIAFGKMSERQILEKTAWFVIFPGLFAGTPLSQEIDRSFEPCFVIQIPLAEYTICRAATQTVLVAFQKKRGK